MWMKRVQVVTEGAGLCVCGVRNVSDHHNEIWITQLLPFSGIYADFLSEDLSIWLPDLPVCLTLLWPALSLFNRLKGGWRRNDFGVYSKCCVVVALLSYQIAGHLLPLAGFWLKDRYGGVLLVPLGLKVRVQVLKRKSISYPFTEMPYCPECLPVFQTTVLYCTLPNQDNKDVVMIYLTLNFDLCPPESHQFISEPWSWSKVQCSFMRPENNVFLRLWQKNLWIQVILGQM